MSGGAQIIGQLAANAASKFIDTGIDYAFSRSADQRGQNRQFQADMEKWRLWENKKWQREQYKRIVQGAQEAGLHPLFALGQGGSSPSWGAAGGVGAFPHVGGGSSGGVAPQIMSRAEQSALAKTRLKREQIAMHRDWIAMQEELSRANKAGQEVNSGGISGTNFDGTRVQPADVATFALKEPPLPKMRPVREEPNVTAPALTTLVTPSGEKIYVTHNEAQADMINEAMIASQGLWIGFRDMITAAGGKFIWNAGRQAYTLVMPNTVNRRAYIHEKGQRSRGYRPRVHLP